MNNITIEIPYWAMCATFTLTVWLVSKYLYLAYEATLRFFAVWKRGFPPAHCDALGEKWEDKTDEKTVKP
jgi:hypothetical protein